LTILQNFENLYIQLFIDNLNSIFIDIFIFTTIHLFNPIDIIKKERGKHQKGWLDGLLVNFHCNEDKSNRQEVNSLSLWGEYE
jgi:hypothetical protein